MEGLEEIFPLVLLLTVISVVVVVWRKGIIKVLLKLLGHENEERSAMDSEQSVSLLGYEMPTLLGKPSFHSIPWSNRLNFFINGESVEIVNPDPSALLATYIREQLGLKGTKLGCEEGGCGACSIVLQDANGKVKAVNSCLRLLCANDGQAITTVEGIGSVNKGLSEEQKRLVATNGTQCGYCTPGWITTMHALLESSKAENKTLSLDDIDTYFDGNICRCTGYRPIMQAFHSFCGDHSVQQQCSHHEARANPSLCNTGKDIEDMTGECEMHMKKAKTAIHSNNQVSRNGAPNRFRAAPKPLHFFNPASGKRYLRPVNFDQLCATLKEFNSGNNYGTVKILGGNTSIGVTKYLNNTAPFYYPDEFNTMIDINYVPELNVKSFDSNSKEIVIGAATTINECIDLLRSNADKIDPSLANNNKVVNHHSIFSVTAHQLGRIANTQVRNAASWAGNLMIFLQYKSFPSDAVLAFTTAYARLQLADVNGNRYDISMEEFLAYNYDTFKAQGLFIVSISMKESSSLSLYQTVAETFKVAQREHNAHAYVDGGFNFQLSSESKVIRGGRVAPVCNSARVVFGGVSQTIFIAMRTQKVLQNAPLNSQTLAAALSALQQDLVAVGINEDSVSMQFLMSVMQSNLYRAFLRCYKLYDLPANVVSALYPWNKPASRGIEVFPLNRNDQPSAAPVGKPVHKLEAPIQATGEAVYPSDEAMPHTGLHGELVYSTKCNVKLLSIDPSGALAMEGVVAVYTAADIPGTNSIGNGNELFVSFNSIVPCIGAPLAVVVATTDEIATKAASKVKVIYSESNGSVPITNLTQAVNQRSFYDDIDGISTLTIGNASSAMNSSKYRAKGRISAGGQYHFYMETQTATATVIDGSSFRVTCGTQDPTNYQTQIASVMGLPSNKVVVQCARAGGGFGGKLTGGLYASAAATLCASKLNKPVKIFNNRAWDMTMQGGREEWIADYEVGFDANGKIQSVIYEFYIDAGSAMNDSIGALYMGMHWADNAYYLPNYQAHATLCKTNTPARTSMRAPGVVQTCLITEMVVERVATELNLPLTSVQQVNFIQDGETSIIGQVITDCTLSNVWNKVITRSQYNERLQRIAQYNQQNMWRKRGIACCPVKYGMGWAGYNAGVRLNVRSSDGYVILSHNGVEIGQGINTKVAQAVAMALGIDISLIRVEKTSTDAVTNGGCTGGSGTSEVVVQAALNACANLNARLDPYRSSCRSHRNTLKTSEWVSLLSSLPTEVSLNVEGWFSPSQNPNQQEFQYYVYAACVTEVELNVLSGEVHVLASELVYDCGRSLNPAVDIGQIEGGLMMGIGYFFNERVKYEEGSGMLKSVGTWEYKPPLAQDIPSVLNVTFIANAYNKDGILGSKAVGEPPYVISNSAYFALKMAIASARQDAGVPGYFNLEVPCTVDVRQTACLVDASRFVL